MKFMMAVDKVVATKMGHTIEFQAGVPTHVPKECWREAQSAGAVPENQIAVADKLPVAQLVVDDPLERKSRIFDAFTTLVERNNRADWGASGAPHQKAIEKVVGFDVDPKERDALWIEFQQLSGSGELTQETARMKAELAVDHAEAAQAAERAAEMLTNERVAREKAEAEAAELRAKLAAATAVAQVAEIKPAKKGRAKARA